MRESLFRGKRIPHGEWIEGFYVHLLDGKGRESHRIYTGYAETDCGDFYPDWYEVDPATVGEFSGKCDDNDRRIFEGDIADGLFCFTTPVRAVCVFKDGAFGLKWTHGGVDHFSAFTSICNVACEMVVGNIYDNPELLEQEVE